MLSYGKGNSVLIDELGKIVGQRGFAGLMQMGCHRLETRVATARLNGEYRGEDGGVVYLVLTAMPLVQCLRQQ